MNGFSVDCSRGEGGGGALRTALILSVATNSPITLHNIRANRKDRGMGGTHVTLIKLLQQVTSAHMQGAEFGSTELKFEPQHLPRGGDYQLSFDEPPFFRPYLGEIVVETDYLEGKDTLTPPIHNYQGAAIVGQAVSTYLVVIASALVFATEPGSVRAYGGTDVPAAQSLEGMDNLFLTALSKMGAQYKLVIQRRGMLGAGGGIVELRYQPLHTTLSPIVIVDTDRVTAVDCYVHRFGARDGFVDELRAGLERSIRSVVKVPVNFHITARVDYPKDGTEIALIVRRDKQFPIKMEVWGEGFRSVEDAARLTRERLATELRSNAPIGRYTCDQLIPLMGLAEGESRILTDRITPHAASAIQLTEDILGVKYYTREVSGNLFEITVDGIGFSRSQT